MQMSVTNWTENQGEGPESPPPHNLAKLENNKQNGIRLGKLEVKEKVKILNIKNKM